MSHVPFEKILEHTTLHTCPIQLHNEIQAALHKRHRVSYGVHLKPKNFAQHCLVLLVLCTLRTS